MEVPYAPALTGTISPTLRLYGMTVSSRRPSKAAPSVARRTWSRCGTQPVEVVKGKEQGAAAAVH